MTDQTPKMNIAKKLLAVCGVGFMLLAVSLLSGVVESTSLSAEVEDESFGSGPDLLEKKHGKIYTSIRVRDDLWKDVQVVSATLEGQDIHLKKKPNVFGLKGVLTTYMSPGEHMVRWTVTKPSTKHNRITLSFKKSFKVPHKGGVTVIITGEEASVY